MDTIIVEASLASADDTGRVAQEIADWLQARGGRSRLVALSAAADRRRELEAADALVLVNADPQGYCNGALLRDLASLPPGGWAGKPVLSVQRGAAGDGPAFDGPLRPLLQRLGAALILNPVALENWDFFFPNRESIALLQGLLALEPAVAFCRRLEAERRKLTDNLELASHFARAPLLA